MNFKYWKKKRNLTRVQLATLVGTSKNYIYEIETGRRCPSKSTLNRITKALNICIIVRDVLECKNCKCKKCKCRKCPNKNSNNIKLED